MKAFHLRSLCLGIGFGVALWGADAQNWVQTSAPVSNWGGVACSADGTVIVAISEPYSGGDGRVYVSTNGGTAWTMTSAPAIGWGSIAASADGTRLVGAASPIYISTNTGVDWHAATGVNGFSCASSSDGTKLIAVYSPSIPSGFIFTSADGGDTWTQASAPPAYTLGWAASSADGSTLLAAGWAGYTSIFGTVALSTNAGVSWWTADLPNLGWSVVASSADGTRLVAAAEVAYDWTGPTIYVSTNNGVTWQATGAPALTWRSVVSSADGSSLAATDGSTVYVSADGGANWTSAGAPVTNWSAVACTADGSKLVAAAGYDGWPAGPIYTLQTPSRPMLGVARSGNRVVVSWVVPSMRFTLQQNSDLGRGNWMDVPTTPSLNYTNLHYEVTLSHGPGAMFYRLASE